MKDECLTNPSPLTPRPQSLIPNPSPPMSTIIKASDRNRAIQGVAFNFDDMAEKARQYLEQVRAEAAKMLAAARQRAQQEAARAEAEGRRAGEAAAAEIVERQLARQLTTLMPALRQAVVAIEHAKQAWLCHWEKSAIHVAAAIAGRLVRRELTAHPEIALESIRQALELAAGSTEIRLHLQPADYQTLRPQVDALVREISALGPLEVIADPQVSPGGCRVETRFGVIDQQLEAQLARIEEELA